MSARVTIKNAGDGREAVVERSCAVRVSQYPPDLQTPGTASRYRYLGGLLGSTGFGSGTTNMNVDGSSTAQEFFAEAAEDHDRLICGISIVIADASVVHSKFGAVNALSTGFDLEVLEMAETTFLIEKAKTGGQVIAQTGFAHGYGDAADAFELTNWTATEDATTVFIPISQWVPGGIRLGRGTQDKIIARVADDLTGLTEFTVRLHGYRHYDTEREPQR